MYSFELTYIPSVESNLKEIQTDASLFMDLNNVRFCDCVPLFVCFSGQRSLTVFCRVRDRCEVILVYTVLDRCLW